MPRLVTLKAHSKTKMLQFHAPIPRELWAAAGRKTHTQSLGVRTRAEAMPLYEQAKGRFDAMLAMWRGAPPRLTNRNIEALVGQWYERAEKGISDDPDEMARWPAELGVLDPLPRCSTALKWGFAHVTVTRAAAALIEEHGLPTGDADLRDRLEAAIGRRIRALLDMLGKRLHGDYSEDPTLRQFPKWAPPGVTVVAPTNSSLKVASPPVAPSLNFEMMLNRWEAATHAPRRPSTVQDTRRHVADFQTFIGHNDPRKVTTDDVVKWRNALLARTSPKLTTATVQRKYLASLNAVFNASASGVGPDYLQANPVVRASIRGTDHADNKPRLPYSPGEVVQILTATRAYPSMPGRRWLPWMFAYTGLRYRSVVEMRARDVIEIDGIWVADLATEASAKRLKAQPGKKSPSARRYPLHPALIAEGFVTYAQSLPPDAYLFPREAPLANGDDNDSASADWREWIKTIVADESLAPSHAFRHLTEDLYRAATEDFEIRKVLQGRATKSLGSAVDYGKGHGLRKLADVVARVPAFAVPPLTSKPAK